MSDLTPTAFAQAVNISVPYASQLLSGSRDISRDIAIRAFRALGVKLGPIANASDAEIDVLERFDEKGPVRAAVPDMAALVSDEETMAPETPLGAGAKSGALQ